MGKNSRLNSVIICLLLFLFAVNAFGQTITISREQIIQDIDTFFSTIEKVHPDMYAVYPKQRLDIHGTLPDYNVEAEKVLDFTIDLITREK